MRNGKAFDAIVAAAIAKGWPHAYTRDVSTHDRNALAESIGENAPFVWILTTTGTYMFWQRSALHAFGCAVRSNPDHAIYVYDGHTLRETTHDDAARAFADVRMAS